MPYKQSGLFLERFMNDKGLRLKHFEALAPRVGVAWDDDSV